MSGEAWYLVDEPPPMGGFVLDGAEGRHAATVRRARPGEQLVLTDGRGTRCLATVVGDGPAGRGTLELQVESVEQVAGPAVTVTVAQALPKGERSELAVDLLTEAGVDAIVPWQAMRCVARWSGPKAERGVQKWQTVAREASKQSRRAWVPRVDAVATTAEVVDLISGVDLALVLHEAQARPITAAALPAAGRLLLIVGPEGGVAPEELETFTAAGALPVRLGHEVLRTSTAGAVALGALGVLASRWS